MQAQEDESSLEVEAAWRLLLLNWIMIGAMGAVLALGLMVTNFSIGLSGLAIGGGYVGLYAGFAHANARSPLRRDPQVIFVLAGIAQAVVITVLMTPLTYIAASIDWPLQDAHLLAIDRILQLDWAGYVRLVDAHPLLATWLDFGYTMIRWPIFAIPVVLAAKHCYRRIEEFIFAFGAALIVTTLISALVPAIGVYHQVGLDPSTLHNLDPQAYVEQLRDLPPTRAGTLRHLDLMGLAGIVTFPSFHAASAVLYAWALWPVKWARPIAVLANGAMLAATPIIGGHYFIDLFAGIAIAVIAIAGARKIGRVVEGHTVRAAAVPVAAVVAPAE
jgi:uncharacterized membrane protein YqaE (UPF0057 family)